MLKNESEFKQKVKDVAEAMRVASLCLMETQYHAKIAFAKDVFKAILRLLRNAAVFIDIYCRKGRIREFVMFARIICLLYFLDQSKSLGHNSLVNSNQYPMSLSSRRTAFKSR